MDIVQYNSKIIKLFQQSAECFYKYTA